MLRKPPKRLFTTGNVFQPENSKLFFLEGWYIVHLNSYIVVILTENFAGTFWHKKEFCTLHESSNPSLRSPHQVIRNADAFQRASYATRRKTARFEEVRCLRLQNNENTRFKCSTFKKRGLSIMAYFKFISSFDSLKSFSCETLSACLGVT